MKRYFFGVIILNLSPKITQKIGKSGKIGKFFEFPNFFDIDRFVMSKYTSCPNFVKKC